jgi:hypothetical protein
MVPGMTIEENCKLDVEKTRAKLIQEAKILIMDEVTMMSRYDLERIDRSLQDVMGNSKPFGGKIVLLSGDFRQILPVENNPVDSVNTCLKRSYLWENGTIQQFPLMINERVRQFGGHKSYAVFLMYVGLGLLSTRKKNLFYRFKHYSEADMIRVNPKIGEHDIIKSFDNIEEFVDHLFPTISTSEDIPEAIILTPKNKNMYEVNDMCLDKFRPGAEVIEIKSRDSPYIPEQDGFFPEELLNNYNPGSLPQHNLRLKEGCSLMLLRNVNLFEGLANGTRLRLKSVSKSGRLLKVEVMTGPKAKKDPETGEYIFNEQERTFPLRQIPNSNDNDRCIRMIRKQFPVRCTYSMSINKAQGQTLKRVGLYLPNPVFSHGQLYVALSRVSSPENITIFIGKDSDEHGRCRSHWYTKNVVYQQLLPDEINNFKSSDDYLGDIPKFADDDVESDAEYQVARNYHADDTHYEVNITR